MKNQIDNIAKPFLKWAGGKTQLINEIEKATKNDVNSDLINAYKIKFITNEILLFPIVK